MTARQIQMEVCARHNVPPEAIESRTGCRQIVAARNEVMARWRVELGMSFAEIGRILHRHHTSVIHGVKNYLAANALTPEAPEHLESALVRQARLIASQAGMLGEQARQIEALASEIAELRTRVSRESGQGEFFAMRRSA
jgi:hypothetical protein